MKKFIAIPAVAFLLYGNPTLYFELLTSANEGNTLATANNGYVFAAVINGVTYYIKTISTYHFADGYGYVRLDVEDVLEGSSFTMPEGTNKENPDTTIYTVKVLIFNSDKEVEYFTDEISYSVKYE